MAHHGQAMSDTKSMRTVFNYSQPPPKMACFLYSARDSSHADAMIRKVAMTVLIALLPAEMVLLNVWLTTEVLILAAWVKIFSIN